MTCCPTDPQQIEVLESGLKPALLLLLLLLLLLQTRRHQLRIIARVCSTIYERPALTSTHCSAVR